MEIGGNGFNKGKIIFMKKPLFLLMIFFFVIGPAFGDDALITITAAMRNLLKAILTVQLPIITKPLNSNPLSL